MKQIFIPLVLIFMLVGCKSLTVEESFRSKLPEKEILYIHTDINNKGAVVFYKAQFNQGVGIGSVVIEGNNKDGWEYLASSTMMYNGGFLLNGERIKYLEDTSIRLFYGIIEDKDTEKISIEDKNGNEVNATIVNTEWKSIWYAFVPVQGQLKLWVYDRDGKVIFKIPGKT